jgi:hypothetical protein
MAQYAHASDDLAQTAASVTASAEDGEYPAENLVSENPAKPAKLTTTTGNWVLEFSGAIAPVAAVLVYQYLDAGLEVRIQGNATNSWGSPSFNQAFTIPPKRLDGPSNQHWTVNPVLEFTGAPSFAFWRLVIVGTNSQVVVVGRLLLLSAWRDIKLYFGGGDIQEGDAPEGQIEVLTELGVENIVSIGGPRRSISAVLIGSDLAASVIGVDDAALFRALHESSEGRQTPFLLRPFDELNDAWLVRFESANRQRSHKVGDYSVWPFSVREVSRGLPWP